LSPGCGVAVLRLNIGGGEGWLRQVGIAIGAAESRRALLALWHRIRGRQQALRQRAGEHQN